MMDMFTYAAPHAAVRAAIGRMLSDADWEVLITASDTQGFLSAAAGTAYGELFADQPQNIEEIEKRLRRFLSDRFRLPIPFLQGAVSDMVDWLWRPFEISNLVILLRGLHNRIPAARIRSFLVPLRAGTQFDWHVLSNASSVHDAIGRIKMSFFGRFYARALENAYNEYIRRDNVFILEVALYLAYYRRLQDLLNRLAGRDGRDAQRIVGTIIDSRNILWAYRYRIFFHLEPETILGYSLPTGGRVNAALIQGAASGGSLVEIISAIWDGRLPDMDRLQDQRTRDALVDLEVIFRRYLHGLALETLMHYPLHFGTILAYLVLVESEVEDLITTLEGVAYGWPTDRIRPCLIGKRGYA